MIRRALLFAAALFAVLAVGQLALAASPVLTVAPGHRVPVSAGGFAARTRVVVQVVGKPALRKQLRSGPAGRVRTFIDAPRRPGSYRLIVVGRARREPVGVPPRRGRGGDGVDRQTVEVEVPRAVSLPFRVRGGRGTLGQGRHHRPGTGGNGVLGQSLHNAGPGDGAGDGAGGLSSTGIDIERWLLTAALALAAGSLLAVLGRRRPRRG